MADTQRSEKQSKELGHFLRSRREKLSPKAVGLAPGQRRRTAGLRREEVAELAGIGIDWYVRLEQGRSVRPSAGTVDALARALRLNKAEHAHLKALTRPASPGAFVRETVPDTVRRIVESLNQPAYVTGRRWDVLAWNKAAGDIFAFDQLAESERNTFLSMLTRPATRKLPSRTKHSSARATLHAGQRLFAGGNVRLGRLRVAGVGLSTACWRGDLARARRRRGLKSRMMLSTAGGGSGIPAARHTAQSKVAAERSEAGLPRFFTSWLPWMA